MGEGSRDGQEETQKRENAKTQKRTHAGCARNRSRPRSCSGRVALGSASADRPVPPSSDRGGRDLHHSPSSSSSSSLRAGFSRPTSAAIFRWGWPGPSSLPFFFVLLLATANRPPRPEYWQVGHCGSPPRQLQPGLSPVSMMCGIATGGTGSRTNGEGRLRVAAGPGAPGLRRRLAVARWRAVDCRPEAWVVLLHGGADCARGRVEMEHGGWLRNELRIANGELRMAGFARGRRVGGRGVPVWVGFRRGCLTSIVLAPAVSAFNQRRKNRLREFLRLDEREANG